MKGMKFSMREFEEIIDKKERSMEDPKLIYEMVSTFMKEYPNMRVNDAVNDVLNMKDILFESFNINPTRQKSQESKFNQASPLSRAERRALERNSKKSKPKQKHTKKKHK